MRTTVLDSCGLLALFFDEPGAEKMEQLFHAAAEADRPMLISAVNWAEVIYKMERRHGKAGVEVARKFEHTMPLDVVPLDRELAESTGLLKNQYGIGLADAFAAALAKAKKAELITADTEFKAVEGEIKVSWPK